MPADIHLPAPESEHESDFGVMGLLEPKSVGVSQGVLCATSARRFYGVALEATGQLGKDYVLTEGSGADQQQQRKEFHISSDCTAVLTVPAAPGIR